MALGLVGRKVGMTRIFTEDGVSIPVTVIEATPNRVTQIKSDATDGYNALQVTAGEKKASRVNKAAAGHFAKAGVEAGRGLWEFRAAAVDGLDVGGELTVEQFAAGQQVDDMPIDINDLAHVTDVDDFWCHHFWTAFLQQHLSGAN